MHWFLFDGDRLLEQSEALALRLDSQIIFDLRVGAQNSAHFSDERGLGPVVQTIARKKEPWVRSLGIYGTNNDLLEFSEDDYPVTLGDLSPLWEKLPNLERLFLHAPKLRLGKPRVMKVREAEISVGKPQADGFIQAMIDTAWPSLERLVLDLGDPQFTRSEATAEDLIHMIEGMPRLRELALLHFCPIDDFMRWLVASPLLEQLESLSLLGTALHSGADDMYRHREGFRHFKHLHIEEPDVGEGFFEELRSLCTNSCVNDRLEWNDWRKHFP